MNKHSIDRRHFIASAGALAAAACAFPAAAQSLKGPVRLVVGFPPGGAADMIARALAEPLKAALGTTVIVDNKPGAGGRLAADYVRNAPADGSVLLVTPASVLTMAPHLYKSVRYELVRDFQPLLPLARLDLGLYAGPGTPASVRTLPDLVKWMQDNPKARSCGVPGIGSTPHMAAELIGRQTGLNWQLVPYQGDAPSFLALLSGEIPVGVSSLAGGIEHLRAGKLRMLALTGSDRSAVMPDIPTLKEAGYDIVVEDRHSVIAPKSLPAPLAATLKQAIAGAMQSRDVGDLLQRLSLQRAAPTDDFAAVLKADSDRWAAAARSLNLALE
ncbi:tripartite tricarboxylate transporter substrate-binding protein [uncultured Pseudacidovorax sp.]|uniref:tripartite tricarboxylate transporter substrate-binding protein n=1 Tax=uncultured Pseudacidovorax sp. TaxID=679313 RepID=UPI0025D29E37|nr:tripartite tricarboxylate transporter substrate-binding protein [uncultured Pseudacidovorax sp.]